MVKQDTGRWEMTDRNRRGFRNLQKNKGRTAYMFLLPSLPMTLGAVAFPVLMGVGFGMYPAVKASGLQPVEALRAD